MYDFSLLVFKSWIQISRFCMQWLQLSNIAINTIKNADYRCIIHNSKSGAINLLENFVL